MSAQRKRQSLGILIVLGLVFAGCSSNKGTTNFKVTPVKGRVTLGSEPLAEAAVTLNMQGAGPAGYTGAGGTTDAQGNFEIMTGTQKGAPAGKYKVTVSKVVGPDGKPIVNDPASGAMVDPNSTKELVPPAFNDPAQSTIELTITDGTPVPDLKIEIPKQ